MTKRLAIIFLLLLACIALVSSGCTVPQRTPYRPADEMTLWLNSIAGLPPLEQGRLAEAKRHDLSAPLSVRDRALAIAAARPGSQGYGARTELARIYASASQGQRSGWEQVYWKELDGMDAASLRQLASKVSREQERRFPWNLVMLKAARRGLAPENDKTLARLSNPALYANPSALGISASSAPTPASAGTAAAQQPGSIVRVALAIPLSGSAGSVGKQIASGANAGAASLQSATGPGVDPIIIDTGAPDWQARLAALPPDCRVIGALIPSKLSNAIDAAPGRAFFSFTPSLTSGEGIKAWRFFTSSSDQIRAVLDAASSVGITSYGVFGTSEPFSVKMGALFAQEARSRGCTVTSGSYSSRNMGAWANECSAFLKSSGGDHHGSMPVAHADFDAIFLPDGWKNMEMLAAGLQYAGGQDKMLLGTMLWEQSLGSGARTNAAAFSHAIFPAAWNPMSSNPAAASLKATIGAKGGKACDWSALGFDFVRFAAALNLQEGWTADSLNSMLAAGPLGDWASARILWSADGKASRRLYIMQPASNGYRPASVSRVVRNITESEGAQAGNESARQDIDRLAESVAAGKQF